jgi:hypothetical protein
MSPEIWFVLTFAAAILLFGIVGSTLAWVVERRRLRSELLMEKRWRMLADRVHGLEKRLTEIALIEPAGMRPRGRNKTGLLAARGSPRADDPSEPKLIAVPSLESSLGDRDFAGGLKERHAAIWALADTGAAPEVIARATGQPIGQIELILGLRRQIDGTKGHYSQGPHD